MEDKFKIKPLSVSQIRISIDRLTRFKHTEEKYLRVFKEIILSNLIYPKYKKHQLDLIEYDKLTDLAQEIFNTSLQSYNIAMSEDFMTNKKLLSYENIVFKLDTNTQKLLENKIDYTAALKLIGDEKLPLNLQWLKSLQNDVNQVENREFSNLKFPIEKIVITEGITEEILLPKFAKQWGHDFDKMGVNLISAGGKNQVVKLFYQLADTLNLPIFVLLDSDAKENFDELYPRLRENDKVYIIKNGEFEDVLPLKLIQKTLNNHFKNFSFIELAELKRDLPMSTLLADIFKEKGLGDFKKSEFAALVRENITSASDLSSEIKKIIMGLQS